MAKIGLQYLVIKPATGAGKNVAKAIQADLSIQLNEAKLYADDGVAESDKSFRDGTLTLGVDDLGNDIQTDCLGHTIDAETGEIVANGNDNNPYVGTGFMCISKKNGVQKFRSIWLPKVQYAEPSETNQTKGESTSFSTPTMTGTIMLDDDANWKYENSFTTFAAAKAYLDNFAGIIPMCTMPVASVPAGTYAVAQSVTLTAGVGETIYYTTDGTTPSATNGTVYTVPISISATSALRAIAVKAESSDSYVATYEYIISAQ